MTLSFLLVLLSYSFIEVSGNVVAYLAALLDFLALIVISSFVLRKPSIWKMIAYALLSGLFLVQAFVLLRVGGYLSFISFENIETGRELRSQRKMLIALFVVLFICLAIDFKFRHLWPSLKTIIVVPVTVVFLGLLPFTPKPESHVLSSFDGPYRSFVVILGEFIADRTGDGEVQLKDPGPDLKAIERVADGVSPFDFKDKNVVVLFIEGFSARWMASYGSIYSDLTPNLDAHYHRSISIQNYYNHTYATYRGLRGQIFSLIPPKGGPNLFRTSGYHRTDLSQGREWIDSLEALRQKGYNRYFYLSQQNSLNTLLESMGFDEVNGSAALQKRYSSDTEFVQTISDEQLFDYLLQDLTVKHARGERFFAGIYNFGTHFGLDADVNYRGRGNEVLNRMHKFDQVFAQFVSAFENSTLFEDTILVVTADHATYPDVHSRAADEGLPEISADRIPFMVFGKGIEPSVIDVGHKSSLAFMPTMLDALDIQSESVLTTGCTMFEACMTNKLIAYGEKHFALEDGAVVELEQSSRRMEYLQLIWKAEAMSRFLK